MDMDMMFTPAISELVKTLIGKGATKLEDEKQIATLRMLLRERIRREARFNRELLNHTKLDLNVRLDNLKTEALEYACGQPLPIEILFSGELNSALMQLLAGDSAKHRMHFARLQTEADLIERLLHRVKLAQLRANEDVSPGDVSYLKKLNNATHAAMS